MLQAYSHVQHIINKWGERGVFVFSMLEFHHFVCCVWRVLFFISCELHLKHTLTQWAKQLWGLISVTFGSRLFDRPSQQARGHHVAAVDPLGLKYADLHAAFSNRKGAPSELVVRNYMLGKGSPLGKASVWNFSILFG
jgi:hypothetical protein